MKRKYGLTRLDTQIHEGLKVPLLLVKYLKNTTISEITSQALESYLPSALEICYEEICNDPTGNPNTAFKDEVVKWLKHFERL